MKKKLLPLFSLTAAAAIVAPVVLTSCSYNISYSEVYANTNTITVRNGESSFADTLQFYAKFFDKDNKEVSVKNPTFNYTNPTTTIAGLSLSFDGGLLTIDATAATTTGECTYNIYANPKDQQLSHHKMFALNVKVVAVPEE